MTTAVPFTSTVDFGATPTDEATAVITGLTDMTTSAHVECWLQGDDTTADNVAANHDALQFCMSGPPQAEARVAGTGFTARFRLAFGLAKGTFKFHSVYAI